MPMDKNNFGKVNTAAAERAALQAAGLATLQVVQPLAPVKTGNLKRSHRMSVGDAAVTIGATADYAVEVHEGTGGRKGNPWLRNGFGKHINEIGDAAINAYKGASGL